MVYEVSVRGKSVPFNHMIPMFLTFISNGEDDSRVNDGVLVPYDSAIVCENDVAWIIVRQRKIIVTGTSTQHSCPGRHSHGTRTNSIPAPETEPEGKYESHTKRKY